MRAYSDGIACEQDQDDQQEAHHLIPGFAEWSTDDLQPGVTVQQVPQLNGGQQNQEAHEVKDCWVYFYCLIEADEPVPRKADSYSAEVNATHFSRASPAQVQPLCESCCIKYLMQELSSVALGTWGCESIGKRPCIWLGDLKKPWTTTRSGLLRIHPANQGHPRPLFWIELNPSSQKERT